MTFTKPKVFKKNGKQRCGKGFSREELKKAGLSFKEALRLGIPVDSRRRTSHKENVKGARAFLKNKSTSKPKRRKPKS